MALAAALVRAAAPMLLRGREAPCSAPALHPRRLLSCSTTSDAPPPPARPLASKLAEPESQLPWREAQAEILRDIEPVVQLIKDILHSDRYGDGECVTSKDEIIIVEKLLAYHPRAEDKIGCGLDAIMLLSSSCQFRNSQIRHGREPEELPDKRVAVGSSGHQCRWDSFVEGGCISSCRTGGDGARDCRKGRNDAATGWDLGICGCTCYCFERR